MKQARSCEVTGEPHVLILQGEIGQLSAIHFKGLLNRDLMKARVPELLWGDVQ